MTRRESHNTLYLNYLYTSLNHYTTYVSVVFRGWCRFVLYLNREQVCTLTLSQRAILFAGTTSIAGGPTQMVSIMYAYLCVASCVYERHGELVNSIIMHSLECQLQHRLCYQHCSIDGM